MRAVVLVSEHENTEWNLHSMFDIRDTEFIQLRKNTHKTLEEYHGTYQVGKELFVSDCGKLFQVFPDWSVKELE